MLSHTIQTDDGHPLAFKQFLPADTPAASILIVAAMGVSQSYYRPLAEWLCERGFQVLTCDFRGMGESRNKPLKSYTNDILDWARLDAKAALHTTLELAQGKPVFWLGHSLGGQIFPLIDGIDQVKQVITIASGTGYWRRNAPALRKKVWFFWHLMVPSLLKLYGYFPGRRFGMVGDLPKPVMQQWRRWCMHPQYCVGVEGEAIRQRFEDLDLPVHSLIIEDDEMLSLRNSEDLMGLFGTTNKVVQKVSPSDFGLKRIGHLGYFREEFADSLWQNTLLPLLTPR